MAETGTEARPPPLQADTALYLDFDGTLAVHAPHPDGVTVEEALPGLLGGLRERLAGAVALVSGRSLAALDAITGLPQFAGAGLHGVEWRLESGGTRSKPTPDGAGDIARALQERFGADARVIVEDKGAAVALHFRQAPERAAECIAAMQELAGDGVFELLRGHAVIEARPQGIDKGAALRTLSTHAPFAGRKPVFVGDDTTDEDGFRAARELGGYGVKVGPGPTAARYRLAAVDGVYAWLGQSLAGLDGEPRT